MELKTVSILREGNNITLYPSRKYYSEDEAKSIENDIFNCFESLFFDEASKIKEDLLNRDNSLKIDIKGMP